MIGYINGRAITDSIVLAGGVGYVIATPQPLVVGEDVSLWVSSSTSRDGVTTLYGFPDKEEQDVFAAVCGVSRVGPGVALSLLRSFGARGVVGLINKKDSAGLSKAAGVGAKTAELIVNLAKTPDGIPGEEDDLGSGAIVEALVNLGYPRERAAEAVSSVDDGGAMDEASLLRAALEELR